MNNTITREEARERVLGLERLHWLDAYLVGSDGAGIASATGDPYATGFYPNQVNAILGWQRLQATEKSRQIGHSFAFAADSVARTVLEPKTTQIHISTDKWESEDKQDYVMRVHDSLLPSVRNQVKVVVENKGQVVLETSKGRAEIFFLAQRPPRGAERGGIYLHEMAHMAKLSAILKAALYATARGGFIKGCSSHEGSDSIFNQIMTNAENEETGEKPYRAWQTSSWPWWTCPAFCHDIELAMQQAPSMDTDERVYKFGTQALIELREGGSLEDFQEECECIVVDEKYSYFPMELIQACQARDTSYWFQQVEVNGKSVDALAPARDVIRDLAFEIAAGRLNGMWLWAMDIGRYNNPDVITIGHTLREDPGTLCLRAAISMSNMEFHLKQEIVTELIRSLPVERGHIDSTGIGLQMSEWANLQWGQKALPYVFTNVTKGEAVNNLKIRMERRDSLGARRLIIPVWSKLARQFHSIKKTVTPSGHPIYDSERNEETHADVFFSLALLNQLIDLPEQGVAFVPLGGQRAGYRPPLGGRVRETGRERSRLFLPAGIRR